MAANPTEGPVEVLIEVERGDPQLEDLIGPIRERVATQLEAAEFNAVRDDSTQVVIALGWLDDDATAYAFAVEIACHDRRVARPIARCRECGTSELFVQIEQEVAATALAITCDQVNEPQQTVAKSNPSAAVPLHAGDGSNGRASANRLGPLGWAGIGVASTGVAAATVGAVLWSINSRSELDEGAATLTTTDFRPPGIALVAGGVAALASGITMLAVDTRRHRGPRPLTLAPVVGGDSIGMSLAARF